MYIISVYIVFTFLWVLIVLLNRFYADKGNISMFVLFIPFIVYFIGIMNADIIDESITSDVYQTTFITNGILLSLPLLTWFNKEKLNKELNHIIFLAMFFTLLTYYHIWIPMEGRRIYKIIRSCSETMAITLYIFALTIFFIR